MKNNKLSALINAYFEKMTDDSRDYIGASSIGSDCIRQIWYQFKGVKAESVIAKFRKIWAVGKHLETMIVGWLIDAGFDVELTDKTYHAKDMPYFQGHFDGIITIKNKKCILEIKTAKNASYTIFAKKGLQSWNPQYYAQVQSYMGMSGIFSAYVLVLNKDNSDICDELVTFDADFYERLLEKARLVHGAKIEPPRIDGSALFFKCKMCKYNKICHK